MTGLRMKIFVLSAILCVIIGVTNQASAQSSSLPEGVAQAIEDAMRQGELAAKNAAFSAYIANDGQPTTIAERTRLQVAQSSLAGVVVESIARYPQATSAIISAAVSRAPDHAPAIVYRANIAFPRFSSLIAAAAGTAPPRYAAAYAPPPLAGISPVAPAASYVPPTIQTAQSTLPKPVATPPKRLPVAARSKKPTSFINEFRFGVVDHDTGVFGRTKEGSVAITLGARLQPLTGDMWDYLQNPRPFINANLNTKGQSSALDIGLNWDWDMSRRTFFSFALGGAAHNGKLKTSVLDRKELGSRVLFYLATEIGYRISAQHSLALRLDHMSNAGLAKNNEGLDTVGLIYGYHF